MKAAAAISANYEAPLSKGWRESFPFKPLLRGETSATSRGLNNVPLHLHIRDESLPTSFERSPPEDLTRINNISILEDV